MNKILNYGLTRVVILKISMNSKGQLENRR